MEAAASPFDTAFWITSAAILFLLVMSGFFSGSETALTAASRGKLRSKMDKGSSGAARALKITEDSERLIGSVLLGNNLVNILATSLATALFTRAFGESGVALATLVMTLLVLIFAEVLPKTYAITNPETAAARVSPMIALVILVFSPVVSAVRVLVRGVLRVFGVQTDPDSHILAVREEIAGALHLGHSEGVVQKEDRDRILGALDLAERTVEEIMLHRSGIEMINADNDPLEILTQCLESSHTRLPVYEGDINEIVGILHIRKMSRILRGGEGELTKEAIKRFTNPTYFIPAETPLHIQLINFQKNKYRLGLVVDEYGEIEGLATLDDILEEIVGDFTTNIFESEDEIIRQDDGSYIIDGAANIRDINKTTHWNLPVDGPKTLNGLALEHIESFPDGRVSLNIDTYRLEVLALSEKMISKLKVWQVTSAQEEEI